MCDVTDFAKIQLNGVCMCVDCAGPVMYGLAVAGMMGSGFLISLAECFVFSSLIVAVDPVAVRQLFIYHLFLGVRWLF